MSRKLNRIAAAMLLALAASSLSACGCGPFGMNYCGGRGGGHFEGPHGGPGGPGGPGGGPRGGWR